MRPIALVTLTALITLVAFIAAPLHAADEPDFPYGVRSADKRLAREIEKAKEEYSDAVKDALDDYERALEREMDRATKRADLQLAMAIKKKLDASKKLQGFNQVGPGEEAAEDGLPVEGEKEPPTKYVYAGNRSDVGPISGDLFTNRTYKLLGVPAQFSGWQVAKQDGGSPTIQSVRYKAPATIYFVSTDGTLATNKGLDKLPQTMTYSDPHRTRVYIYKVTAERGYLFRAPKGSGFLGSAFLLPPSGR